MVCGKSTQEMPVRTTYCCQVCARKARSIRDRIIPEPMECRYSGCSNLFEHTDPRTLHCSARCRASDRNERRERAIEILPCAAEKCSNPVRATHGRKYCSRLCGKSSHALLAYQRQKASNGPLICVTCGAEIKHRRADALYCSIECKSPNKRGDRRPSKRSPIGSLRLTPQGYVDIKADSGWKRRHRFVMEQHIGRQLSKDNTVHHKNGVRTDNRIENLELWSSSQPSGQRVVDKLTWARELIATYGDLLDQGLLGEPDAAPVK